MKNLRSQRRQGMNIVQLNLMLVSTRKRVHSIIREAEWLERVRRNWLELYGSIDVSQIRWHLRQLSTELDLLKKRESEIRRQIRRFWKEAYPEGKTPIAHQK